MLCTVIRPNVLPLLLLLLLQFLPATPCTPAILLSCFSLLQQIAEVGPGAVELLLAECPQLLPLLLRLLFSRQLTNSSKEGLLVVLVQYPQALQMVFPAEQHPYENNIAQRLPALQADVGVVGQPQERRQQQQEDHQPYQQQQHYNHQQQQQQQDKQQQRLAWLPSPGALLLQLATVTASVREEDLDVLDAGWFLCASVSQQLSKCLAEQTHHPDVMDNSPHAGVTCHGDSIKAVEHARALTEVLGTNVTSGRVYGDIAEGVAGTTSGGQRRRGEALMLPEVVGAVAQSLRLLATADCPESSVRYLKAVVRAGVAVAEGCLGHLRHTVEAEVGAEAAVVQGGGTSAPFVSKQKVAAGANIDSGRSTDLQVQKESLFKGEQLVLRLQEGLAECLEADVALHGCVAQLWELLGSTDAVLTYIKGQYEVMAKH